MMPKSTAPTESRLALSPIITSRMVAKNSANGMFRPNDDRAAKVAQEDPLDQENQQASEDQVVQHGVRGDGDQRRPVVERNDLDSARQAAVVIQRVDRLP